MYPTLAEIHDDLAYLFQMLTGQVAPSLDKALYHGWTLQGYLQSLLIPVETAGTMAAKSFVDLGKLGGTSIQSLIDAIEALLNLSKGAADTEATPAVTRLQANGLIETLGPALLIQLAQTLLPGLMEWMKTWLSEGQLQEFINNLLSKKQPATA